MRSSSSIVITDAAARVWPRYWPLALLLLGLLLICDQGGFDRWLAWQFYDAASGGFPARRAFWAAGILHRGGIWLIAFVALAALALLLGSLRDARCALWRREAALVLICIIVTTSSAALLKSRAAADCPWDVEDYGGSTPYYRVFETRPAGAAPGHCFPGAHSSGGFSLLALAFIVARRRPQQGLAALVGAFAIGTGFAATQWLRGAHFASHDVASALLAWTVTSLAARGVFRT